MPITSNPFPRAWLIKWDPENELLPITAIILLIVGSKPKSHGVRNIVNVSHFDLSSTFTAYQTLHPVTFKQVSR